MIKGGQQSSLMMTMTVQERMQQLKKHMKMQQKLKVRHFQICNRFKTVRDINLKPEAYDKGRIAEFINDDHDGSRADAAAEEAYENAAKAENQALLDLQLLQNRKRYQFETKSI